MKARQRWLYVLLPQLAMDLLARAGMDMSQAQVVISGDNGRRLVFQANAIARSSGVQTGMAVATAQAIRGDLQLSLRNPGAEQQALAHLAGWAYGYSSRVAIQPPGLLLEMGGSHRLFGPDVLARMSAELLELGYRGVHGHGPTPAGARLAAQMALAHARNSSAFERIRGSAPLELTELAPAHIELLHSCGLQTLGEVQALPRDGLIRRIGRAGLKQLDLLNGQQPEPIREYRPPLNFSSRIELPAPMVHTQALLFPLRRLLIELCAHLSGSDRAVQHLQLRLTHETGVQPAQHRFEVGLLVPGRDAEHLLDLCRYALEKQQLAGSVIALELHVPQLLVHQPVATDLFQTSASGNAPDWTLLMDRLRGRLGAPAIQQFKLIAEHRPERAFSHSAEPVQSNSQENLDRLAAQRPLWLLPEPVPVRIEDYQLCGPPERIESGWWDGADAARDYYRALDPQARRLWLYQDRRNPHRWFLHGIFG